jgi:hypothetical protein
VIDLRPGYDRVLRCRSGPNGISACLGVVTTPPYLVTTTLVVTTLVSRGCNLSVQQRPVYTASKTWFESGGRTELLAGQVVLKNAGVPLLLGCRHHRSPTSRTSAHGPCPERACPGSHLLAWCLRFACFSRSFVAARCLARTSLMRGGTLNSSCTGGAGSEGTGDV